MKNVSEEFLAWYLGIELGDSSNVDDTIGMIHRILSGNESIPELVENIKDYQIQYHQENPNRGHF